MQLKTNLFLAGILMISQLAHGQTATFSSNFEDENTDPEVGSNPLLETGTSGSFNVVPNPHSDERNSSSYVLAVSTEPGTGGRAEYTAGRYETNEKKYIYTWKRFHPTDMFTDIDISGWVILNQWKTWPCEYYGAGQYDFSDEICYGGGIFNDMRYEEPGIIDYMSRAAPSCSRDYYNLPKGLWNEFVLEIYWTNSNNGYYRIWRNDTLFGYSDNIKTLFDGFLEGTCDLNWSTGLYTYWGKTGGETADSLTAYIDDIAIYDIDNGYTIDSVCPECEAAPFVTTDSIVYKVNVNRSFAEPDDFNNYIISWKGDTCAMNLSSTFAQSKGIDLYLFSEATAVGNNSLHSECFPEGIITTSVSWSDTETHQISLKDLNTANTYTFRLLSATAREGTRGVQIWTNEENSDIVYAANNTCNMAELTNLAPDHNGDLTINVKSVGSAGYINGIEIVEYPKSTMANKNSVPNYLNVFPNPVNSTLNVMGETIPSSITIFSIDGRQISHSKNTNTINLSHLKQGIYTAVINLNGTWVTEKIIKE